MSMRYETLVRNSDFSRAYARGTSYVHPQLVLYVNRNRCRRTRVGITATKKVGNAVARNRARRVVREALAAVLPECTQSVDLVIVCRGVTPKLKSWQVARTLEKLLRRAELPAVPAPAKPGAQGSASPENAPAPAAAQSSPAPEGDAS